LTWHNPVWRGVIGFVGGYSGDSIGLNVPPGLAAQSDGINPPVFERLEYHSESFRTISGGATADFDMFRLSAVWYQGTFNALATLTKDDGVQPPQSSDIEVRGMVHGFRLAAHWPALRYRDDVLEASIGPIAAVGWMHSEASHIPVGSILTRDTFDILTGSFGPKASVRAFIFDRFALEANADYSFITGAARGWTKEFTVGVGYKF